MRALQIYARRPLALLGLGAALTLLAPSCACGIGFVALPLLWQELVRLTLVEALRLGPTSPAQPLIGRRTATTWLSVVLTLGVLTIGAISGSGAISKALSALLRYPEHGGALAAPSFVTAASISGALLGTAAVSVLLGPLMFLAYASIERERRPGDAFLRAAEITGALPWSRVALISAAVPLMIAPFALLGFVPGGTSYGSIIAAAATTSSLVPLVFCAIAAAYAEAAERLAARDPGTPAAEAETRSVAPVVSVACALAALLGVLLVVVIARPSTLELAPSGVLRERGQPLELATHRTVSGTSVHLAAAATGVVVSVDDGGGAGLIEGVPQPTHYRTEPRPRACRTCFALGVHNGSDSGSTVLDAGGVRHDDGPEERLARGVGVWCWLAIGAALVLSALSMRWQKRAPSTLLFLVVIALLTAVIDLARTLWR